MSSPVQQPVKVSNSPGPKKPLISSPMAGAITVIVFGAITVMTLFTRMPPGRGFLLSVALITAWVLVLGKSLSMNRWWGALINNRNLMSMSRLQTILWSVVIFAGLLVIMLLRIRHGLS